MRPALTKPMDWVSLQAARLAVHCGKAQSGTISDVRALLESENFFGSDNFLPQVSTFSPRKIGETTIFDYQFPSPCPSAWPENDVVHGRLFQAGADWREKATTIVLHGWNAHASYRSYYQFLAWQLARAGVNACLLQLPFHGLRRPNGRGAVKNFISDDLLHVVGAARQSLHDARAVISWLESQGNRRVGVWGLSMGAWLAALLGVCDARTNFLALFTPVVRMDLAIQELGFCKPIRDCLAREGVSVRDLEVPMRKISPAFHRPLVARERIFIVKSEHDMFARPDTVEELWENWGRPPILRVEHSHISVLMSVPVLRKVVDFVRNLR
jgi:esterase/lipase